MPPFTLISVTPRYSAATDFSMPARCRYAELHAILMPSHYAFSSRCRYAFDATLPDFLPFAPLRRRASLSCCHFDASVTIFVSAYSDDKKATPPRRAAPFTLMLRFVIDAMIRATSYAC